MKKFRLLSWLCVLIALLLSHFMCINVSFNYARMLCQIEHAGASAPASIAFFSAIPYLIGIVLFAVSAAFILSKIQKITSILTLDRMVFHPIFLFDSLYISLLFHYNVINRF